MAQAHRHRAHKEAAWGQGFDLKLQASGDREVKKYRIVTDSYLGYAVEVWRLWWPFWVELGCNTFSTEERAEAHIRKSIKKVVRYVKP